MSATVVVVTVAATTTADLLDPLDDEVAGVYAVELGDGPDDHPSTPRRETEEGDDPLHEAALDAFHDRVAIATLDHFSIACATLAPGAEAPADARWV